MSSPAASTRAAGIILAAATLLAMVFIAHHPVAFGPHDAILTEIVALQTVDHIIHGGLIGLMLGFLLGHIAFARMLGAERLSVAAGLLAYAAGITTVLAAATLDGFTTPAIALHFLPQGPAAAPAALNLLIFCSLAIQSFSHLGLVLMSLGIACWAATLLATRRHWATGGLGLTAAAASIWFVTGRATTLTPATLLLALAAQAAWNVSAVRLMVRQTW